MMRDAVNPALLEPKKVREAKEAAQAAREQQEAEESTNE